MSNTPNNNIPYVPENTVDPAAGLNDALNTIDALLQLSVIGEEDAPPSGALDGDRYLVGTGSGDWASEDGRIARYVEDGDYWAFFDAVILVNEGDGCLYIKSSGVWAPVACVS